VTWRSGHDDEKLVVVCYFTDPKAVDQALGAAGLGGPAPGSGSGSGSGSGTGTPTPTPGGGNTGGGQR
jgi:hypothetical protein